MSRPLAASVMAALVAISACGGSDSSEGTDQVITSDLVASDAPDFVDDVLEAIDAVETELGGPQRYFEVTSNAQFTNVFVAIDDATAAVAYVFVDSALQEPAPPQPAEGRVFERSDVQFDPDLIVSNVITELPDSVVDAISVYGNGAGATYVLAATSSSGGFLDIEVGPTGQIFGVDPV